MPAPVQTGDAFWDAAQQQLAATGELHNNVRMTWGKAPLGWAPSPAAALAWTLHLNHKFALDGCDPCSYAGVLWCFGQVGCCCRRMQSVH
jgi:deoxyribodipyrimidine photo-lyase